MISSSSSAPIPRRRSASWAALARDRAGGGAGLDVVALLDPGPRADPLVRGVDQLGEVGVRHHPLGHVGPERRDRRPSLAHAAPSSRPVSGHSTAIGPLETALVEGSRPARPVYAARLTHAASPDPSADAAGDPERVPCTECARCCRYLGVGINAPTTPRLATDVLWYLYHEHVSVYRDEDGEWSVLFETRCKNLQRRPALRRLRAAAAHLPQLRQHRVRGERPERARAHVRASPPSSWPGSRRSGRGSTRGSRAATRPSAWQPERALAHVARAAGRSRAKRGSERWPKPSRWWAS